MKTLYIVATPIGNLEDITLRALRILKEVDIIAAEDTRQTRKLLRRYGITTQLTSYFEHNEIKKAEWLISQLKHGKDVALVYDAGTPGISGVSASDTRATSFPCLSCDMSHSAFLISLCSK